MAFPPALLTFGPPPSPPFLMGGSFVASPGVKAAALSLGGTANDPADERPAPLPPAADMLAIAMPRR
jgi:hypothetical protein